MILWNFKRTNSQTQNTPCFAGHKSILLTKFQILSYFLDNLLPSAIAYAVSFNFVGYESVVKTEYKYLKVFHTSMSHRFN